MVDDVWGANMQIVLKEHAAAERAEHAELCISLGGEARALMVLALDPAGRDAEGFAGSVREELCDLVERLDDWIRRDQRLVVSRGDSPCDVRRRLFAGFGRLQGF